MKYSRAFEVERSSVDPEKGTFRATVFTGGEASDGHILNIAGGDIPESIPLFVNHEADPRSQLGTLHFDSRNDNEVVMRGEIFTEGEGAEADIRRDIVAKMAAGHVSRLSGRWDTEDGNMQRRTSLPKDHPAFVDETRAKSDFRFRMGVLFEKWRALEGSIVGIGADPAAVMREFGEDPELSDSVRAFWRGLAEEESEVESDPQEIPVEAGLTEIPEELVREEPEPVAPQEVDFLASFSKACREMIERGIDPEEMVRELEEARIDTQPSEVEVLRNELTQVRQEIAELREGRVWGTADSPIKTAKDLKDMIQEGRKDMKNDLAQQVRDYVAMRRGARIEDEARLLAAQKIESLLAKRR